MFISMNIYVHICIIRFISFNTNIVDHCQLIRYYIDVYLYFEFSAKINVILILNDI